MRTVLVVDDDALVLRFCVGILAGLQRARILAAASGAEAIDVAAHYDETIDLLVSDIMMPGGISGVELALRLTAIRPGIKVLLMSGHCPDEFTVQAEWRFLPKPFRAPDLIGNVESLLRSGSALNLAS